MKSEKYWKTWLKAAGVRAVKTIAQTAVATIGTAAAMGAVDWPLVASAAALSGMLSLLTSIAGLPEVSVEMSMKTMEVSTGTVEEEREN